MQCTKPKTFGLKKPIYNFVLNKLSRAANVPCGKCEACRMNRSTEWGDRLMHESESHSKKCFVTLTYDHNNLPVVMHIDKKRWVPSLKKRDIQLFHKKLRQQFGPFKFYLAGEYGPQTKRPHYHAIYFGIDSMEMQTLGHKLWNKCDSKNFKVQEVNEAALRYTTKYLTKTDPDDPRYFYIEKPFNIASNGIGKTWALKNRKHLIKDGCLIWPNGKKHPIPRYYRKLLKIDAQHIRQITNFNLEKYLKENSWQASEQREKNLIARSELTKPRRDL